MIFIQLGWKILVLASIHYSQQLIFFKAYGTQCFLYLAAAGQLHPYSLQYGVSPLKICNST